MTRVLLRSRSAQRALLAAFAMWVLAALIGRRSMEINLSATFPPTKLVVGELCVVATATLLAVLTRPQFWEWDRIAGGARPRTVAGTAAASNIALSSLCVPAMVPWLPPATSWTWVLANALVLSTTVLLLAPPLTPLLAGAATVVLWLAGAITTNLAPDVWLPLTNYRDQNGQWTVATVLVAAAVVVHASTCGRTAWAHRRLSGER